jgi:ferredoxin-NADP reductase/mono/diheme cytochrome c family protein
MLLTSTSVALGLIFVLIGGLNVWLVLEAWSRVKTARASSRMLTLHRVGGYLFIGLYCVMAYFMVARLGTDGGDTSPTVTVHLILALILSPLLFIKVLIARYYKNQHSLLLPIGLTIFVLAFVLIASTTGPYLARAGRPRAPAGLIDLDDASVLMQKRCSKCHTLDRIAGARKDAAGWAATVNRMRAIAGAGISEADAQTIVSFLTAQRRPPGSEKTAQLEVARALVDQRCSRCHPLDRVYKTVQGPEQWRETVTRMVDYAAGSTGAFHSGEDQQIIEFLSATQSLEAVNQRKSQADGAAAAGRSLIAQNDTPGAPPAPAPASQSNRMTLGFISVVCAAAITLVMRRPGARAAVSASAPAPNPIKNAAPRPPNSGFVLQLVQVTPQTPDTKTLRFAVTGPRKLDALPGQFLTFSFLFDGKKETRCYSICSSPARSGYVEITPKRVNNGCVSVFLNDRAVSGLTVEAAGPSGQFFFDQARDRKIVLLAAGSGITPMMAMLSYLDDLCLDTQATLLYCVRTGRDIIFHRELDELQARLKAFRYQVLLSQPDPGWHGARGHVNREFIRETVPELEGRTFFLCGPPPFMNAARRILTELGVEGERIRQETFGGAGAEPKPQQAPSGAPQFVLEFARSGKTGVIQEGQSLLEAAVEAGVAIPSACRQGQCGTCKTRLIEGDVWMSAENGLDPESKARDYILTCVGHARGNVKLDA